MKKWKKMMATACVSSMLAIMSSGRVLADDAEQFDNASVLVEETAELIEGTA